jgi:Na+-translocating ferredoxin:NAD+ oxidoreductase RnfD subunit
MCCVFIVANFPFHMAKSKHPLRKRELRVHHTMVNYLMPIGLVIMAALLGYWAQTDRETFHQYLIYILSIGIMFGAFYILKYHPKHVFA